MEEEIRLLRLKFERSEKYAKEIEALGDQKMAKECQNFEEKIRGLESSIERLKKEMGKESEEQLKICRLNFEKERTELQSRIK